MSADIKPKVQPLAVGDPVRVIAGTYFKIKVGTVARIARVRPHRSEPPLYELEGYPEYLFWARELMRDRVG